MPTFWQLTYIFAQPQMTSLHALALEQVCNVHCTVNPAQVEVDVWIAIAKL
jgi:hypothetical protein